MIRIEEGDAVITRRARLALSDIQAPLKHISQKPLSPLFPLAPPVEKAAQAKSNAHSLEEFSADLARTKNFGEEESRPASSKPPSVGPTATLKFSIRRRHGS